MFFRILVAIGKEDNGRDKDELGRGGDEQGSRWEGGGEERANTFEEL